MTCSQGPLITAYYHKSFFPGWDVLGLVHSSFMNTPRPPCLCFSSLCSEFTPPKGFALRSGSPAAVCDPGSDSAHSWPRMPLPQPDEPQEERNTATSTFLLPAAEESQVITLIVSYRPPYIKSSQGGSAFHNVKGLCQVSQSKKALFVLLILIQCILKNISRSWISNFILRNFLLF